MPKITETKYKIKYNQPNKFDIYERAVKQFGVDFEKGVVFTIGNKIYANQSLPDHLIIHETTHIRQQAKMGIEKWWNQYFKCEEFRFLQEVEAYKNQYNFAKKTCRDRNQVFNLLKKMAKDLSGSMYGNLCSFSKALEVITTK